MLPTHGWSPQVQDKSVTDCATMQQFVPVQRSTGVPAATSATWAHWQVSPVADRVHANGMHVHVSLSGQDQSAQQTEGASAEGPQVSSFDSP
jgi:hypothetical protein